MNDLISRQAARKALAGLVPFAIYDESTESYANGLADADRVICRLRPEKQWIPCSERLPENEDIYLVTFDKSNLLDNETQVTYAYWINNQWQYGVLESYEHKMPKLVIEPIEELKVIAWMPFLEPYKGDKE